MTGVSGPLNTPISGYDFGSPAGAQSPISLEALAHLEQTLGWTSEDEQQLRRHSELFRSQAERMVDTWRAVIAAQPHLSSLFAGADGRPDDAYKAAVKRRFVQWVVDVATRLHDRTWLNYQEEIGLRHTPEKKNKTDGAHTPAFVPLRYLLAFIPVVTNVQQFFDPAISDREERAALERAWTKAVHLHVTLWSRPYTREGLF
jgi:Protoglobin